MSFYSYSKNSPYDSEWLDCIPEDEKYLETTTFYDECNIIDLGNPNKKDIFINASINKCSGPRRCQNGRSSDGDRPFVGYDPFYNCTCPITLYPYAASAKRASGKIYTTSGGRQCRVWRTRLGKRRALCDVLINARSEDYNTSIKIASFKYLSFDITEDPAICGFFGENCIQLIDYIE